MGGLVGRHSFSTGFVRVVSDERLDSYGLRMFLAATDVETFVFLVRNVPDLMRFFGLSDIRLSGL